MGEAMSFGLGVKRRPRGVGNAKGATGTAGGATGLAGPAGPASASGATGANGCKSLAVGMLAFFG